MSKLQTHFEVGNKVRRVGPSCRDVKQGEVYTIRSVDWPSEELDFEGLETFGYNVGRFELVDENMNKQFTKDDLVAGKHVFEIRSGGKYLLLHSNIGLFGVNLNGDTYFGNPVKNKNDLTGSVPAYDIMKVYEISDGDGFSHLQSVLRLIWQREEKSQSQIELEKLQKQISELQEQAKRLEKSL